MVFFSQQQQNNWHLKTYANTRDGKNKVTFWQKTITKKTKNTHTQSEWEREREKEQGIK